MCSNAREAMLIISMLNIFFKDNHRIYNVSIPSILLPVNAR
jgi:hypothetical protein